jgi:hypothetical protein
MHRVSSFTPVIGICTNQWHNRITIVRRFCVVNEHKGVFCMVRQFASQKCKRLFFSIVRFGESSVVRFLSAQTNPGAITSNLVACKATIGKRPISAAVATIPRLGMQSPSNKVDTHLSMYSRCVLVHEIKNILIYSWWNVLQN